MGSHLSPGCAASSFAIVVFAVVFKDEKGFYENETLCFSKEAEMRCDVCIYCTSKLWRRA